MKKTLILVLAITSILLTSCAGELEQVNLTELNASTSAALTTTTATDSTGTTESQTTATTVKTDDTATAAVGDDYFDDAIFVGNSLMVDYCDEIGIDDWRRIAYVGLDVKEAFNQKVKLGDTETTLMNKVKNTSNFNKAYIEFGLNELGWVYASVFIDYYEQIIGVIREQNPDCIIYVESLLPVSQKKSDNDEYENNENTARYNELLKEMCTRVNAHYIDLVAALGDENGVLPANASTDGVHIGKGMCLKWQECLKTHTVAE